MISVVIPAYNSEETIGLAIKGVLSQIEIGEFELIVVDDGSTDKTAQIIKSFSVVKYIYQENAGPASARNRGAHAAEGDIIFFTDSDCIPSPDWIAKLLVYFCEPEIAVVSGTYDLVDEGSLLSKCIHQEIMYRHKQHMPVYPKSFGSYNFSVRKKVFDEVGGFNQHYRTASGEDNDLSYKILKAGYRIYFANDARVQHHHTSSLKKYLREQFNHGFWRVKMYLNHPDMVKGDDYTFWKDIVEPILVFGIIFSGGLAFVKLPTGLAFFLLLVILMIIEIVYGFLCIASFFPGLFWAAVMFLRSFARTFGFTCGLPVFSLQKSTKKFK